LKLDSRLSDGFSVLVLGWSLESKARKIN